MNFFGVIFGLFLISSTALAQNCDPSLLVEEVNLSAGDSFEQDRVLLSADEGQSVVCQKNSNYRKIFKTAERRLKSQRKNLTKFRRLGLLIPGEYDYYSNFFDQLSGNLKDCEGHVNSLQTEELNNYQTRITFAVKPTGVSQIRVYDRKGNLARSYKSHLQWFGKIIYDENVHLCEARVVTL